MGRQVQFREYVHTPYFNVDVEVDKVDKDDNSAATLLTKETEYNIFCFAEDDWKIESQHSVKQSVNWQLANTATPNMTIGTGNEITYPTAQNIMDTIGLITTLDLTPPSITVTGIASIEDR